MKRALDQIRQLLNQIEADLPTKADSVASHRFTGVELMAVVQQVIDDLQPLLTPYQATYYWYLFGNSILRTGHPVIRVSTRAMRKGVSQSSRGALVSEGQVRETLAALDTLGAIRKEGEPNRAGTPYRILVPDEIEACRAFRVSQIQADSPVEVPESELDYYNVKENRIKVYERDGYKCTYCDKQLTILTATLDHIQPIENGGDNSFENLTTACLHCNSTKNNRRVGDYLADR